MCIYTCFYLSPRIDDSSSSSWQHGGIDAVPMELQHHHLILQIIELNLQTGSVVLRVRDMSGRVLCIYRKSNRFDPVVTRGINMGMWPDICCMTVLPVLHSLTLMITYLLTARRLLDYRSFFPVTVRLNGKGFDGSTALLRWDRHLRQIAGNVTRFPEFLPRSVPIRDIMEVLLNILYKHRLCCLGSPN